MQIRLLVPQSLLAVLDALIKPKIVYRIHLVPLPPPLQIHKHSLQFLLGQVESKQGVLRAMRQSSECRQTKLD